MKSSRRLGLPHLRQPAPKGLAAAIGALIAVQDRVAGEQRQIGVGVSRAGGRVGPGEQVENIETVGDGSVTGRPPFPGLERGLTMTIGAYTRSEASLPAARALIDVASRRDELRRKFA